MTREEILDLLTDIEKNPGPSLSSEVTSEEVDKPP